jgi:microcin C transport system permease protein
MIWPPIRYSYTTANSYIPHSAPTAPFWLLDEGEACSAYPLKDEDPGCTLGNMNWLGTDDQARDVPRG